MKLLALLLITLPASGISLAAGQASGQGEVAPQAAKKADREADDLRQVKLLADGIKIGREWQAAVKSGRLSPAMTLWGYTAFDDISEDGLLESLQHQYGLLGKVKYCELLTERCLVDLEGTAAGEAGEAPGVYVTLSWLAEYENGTHRETMILHEPKKQGAGLKIVGLRRESLPEGRQAAAELAAGLGQLALLKLRGAPRDRWEPWQREAAMLAEKLKLSLPEIPEAANTGDDAAGEKLAALIMQAAPSLFDGLGPGGGQHEGKAILNAFALLLLYEPGEETITRLAVLAGAESEKAGIPDEVWKPLIRAVAGKEEFPAVNEAVQRMAAGISAHVAREDLKARLKAAPRLILDQALLTMESLPTYKVRAEFTAADSRKCLMEASLAPGAMYLRFTGFDGRKESRIVNHDGFFLSSDENKTWRTDPDPESARGLCRTLQKPLDRTQKITAKHAFTLTGVEKVDGEELYRFHSPGAGKEGAVTYWVLITKNGPVIRRAQMPMKFGDISAEGVFAFTRLGREPDIPALESIPAPEK